jgi:hypothetical protein
VIETNARKGGRRAILFLLSLEDRCNEELFTIIRLLWMRCRHNESSQQYLPCGQFISKLTVPRHTNITKDHVTRNPCPFFWYARKILGRVLRTELRRSSALIV